MMTHWLWGFSKDFCLNGFRMGVLASKNAELMRAISEEAYFTTPPTVMQRLLTRFLRDEQWLDRFMQLNHERLRTGYKFVLDQLDAFNQKCKSMKEPVVIRYLAAYAGFFLWVDLSPILRFNKTDISEPELVKRERQLFLQLIEDGHVYIAPGRQAFHARDIGWFRIIFAHDLPVLQLAMQRIFATLDRFVRA